MIMFVVLTAHTIILSNLLTQRKDKPLQSEVETKARENFGTSSTYIKANFKNNTFIVKDSNLFYKSVDINNLHYRLK